MTSPKVESLTGTSNFSSSSSPISKTILVIFGTRPEAIKLCPLISALRSAPINKRLKTIVCVTGQHREMLDQVLRPFDIQPDFDLQSMRPGQTLPALTGRLLVRLAPVLEEVKPALTIVQGDTTSTFCGALSSFFAHVPVAHVEAGLRTFDLQSPFPEEAHRLLTSDLAALHFAATAEAATNLVREGIACSSVEVTGNTGIDAVLALRDRLHAGTPSGLNVDIDVHKKLIVVTAHRRESFGEEMNNICNALLQLAARNDVQIVWPVHRNPNVFGPVHQVLGGRPNITLIDPLDYVPFVDLMQRAFLLLTDSGGIQEEAPSLGKPVLVLRPNTERPEAVQAGTVKLVGTDPAKIVEESVRLLEDASAYREMAWRHNPYGDGRASERIVRRIASLSRGSSTISSCQPLLHCVEQGIFFLAARTGRRSTSE